MSDVRQAMVNMVKSALGPKKFSTGSRGFFAHDKITVDGHRYQAQAQAVLIGSKNDKRARVQATAEEMVAALAELITHGEFTERTFSSGKSGYRIQGKVDAHGQRFQSSAQAVILS